MKYTYREIREAAISRLIDQHLMRLNKADLLDIARKSLYPRLLNTINTPWDNPYIPLEHETMLLSATAKALDLAVPLAPETHGVWVNDIIADFSDENGLEAYMIETNGEIEYVYYRKS